MLSRIHRNGDISASPSVQYAISHTALGWLQYYNSNTLFCTQENTWRDEKCALQPHMHAQQQVKSGLKRKQNKKQGPHFFFIKKMKKIKSLKSARVRIHAEDLSQTQWERGRLRWGTNSEDIVRGKWDKAGTRERRRALNRGSCVNSQHLIHQRNLAPLPLL